MQISRRTLILGGVSAVALTGLPLARTVASAPPPTLLYDPALVTMAGAIAVTSDLLTKRGLIGLDFGDVRTVLGGGGRAYYGEGAASGQDRARVAADRALKDLRRSLSAAGSVSGTV
jgi:hypothetical protein